MKISACLLLILVFSISVFSQKTGNRSKPLAQNFTATSLKGESFELTNLKGKVVVVTFWSTRCAICVAEIPRLNELAESYKNKDVVFLGLAMQKEKALENFLRKNPFNFHILPDAFDVVFKFAEKDRQGRISMGFPTHFLINQKGEIELKTSGFDKTVTLDKTIKSLLRSNEEKVE